MGYLDRDAGKILVLYKNPFKLLVFLEDSWQAQAFIKIKVFIYGDRNVVFRVRIIGRFFHQSAPRQHEKRKGDSSNISAIKADNILNYLNKKENSIKLDE
jgi:hypothetical protein